MQNKPQPHPPFEDERPRGTEKHREKSHDGKTPLTKAAAVHRMHEIANRTDTWIAAYPCEFCVWWHVGSYTKIAEAIGLKRRTNEPRRTDRVTGPMSQGIGEALGDLKKKLRELYPETPLSHWSEHFRTCASCSDAFWRGRRLCPKGALLYHNSLAWKVRQEAKEKRRNA